MKTKQKTFLIFIILFYLSYFILDMSGFGFTPPNTQKQITIVDIPVEANNKIPLVYFCPQDNCSSKFLELVSDAQKIDCAFYDLDLEYIIKVLEDKNARVIVDYDNFEIVKGKITNLKPDTRSAIMHNKFCVIDNGKEKFVWTGSFNPTQNGDLKNNNNVIVIYSNYIAKSYSEEFEEMWNGNFGRSEQILNPTIKLNGDLISVAFCPEDDCEEKVLTALSSAKESIYFMTFSFTSDLIGAKLIEKFKLGVDVRGVFEKRQKSKYSEFSLLNNSGLAVVFDKNPNMMHHKVFIIDGETVITGSYNPTANANKNNDENILIIKNFEVAKLYLDEFEKNYLD